MATRVLLLSILLTEVLKPVYNADVKGIGTNSGNKGDPKLDGLNSTQSKHSKLMVEIQPHGDVVLGKRNITLNCLSDFGQDITWLHNGIPAPPCGLTRCTFSQNGSLLLHKNSQMIQKSQQKKNEIIKHHEKNEYRCMVRSTLGGSIRSSSIFIKTTEIARKFRELPKNITVQEGEVARFFCSIDSISSSLNITWEHNGKMLSNSKSKYYMISPGVLYINATKPSDAGSYRCVVTNNHLKKPRRSKTAKLVVNQQSDSFKPPSLFPQIIYNHMLINGSSLNIACATSGFPYPLITWTFIPQYSDYNNNRLPRILFNSTASIGVLSLKNLSVSDDGIYVCTMTNLITKDVEKQNITVNILVPPSFIKKPLSQVCPSGRTARFECQAQGIPVPEIYWLKNAENVTINGRNTTYPKEDNKQELVIASSTPSDAGVYQCVAVNIAGEIWAAGQLQVNTSRNSPAAPTSLKCRSLSSNRILITWEPPKFFSHSITAYTVHYTPVEGGKELISLPERGNITSVEITRALEPFTNYSFYIRGWNNHGASNPSVIIVCPTAQSVPNNVPKIQARIISSTKLNVSWTSLNKREAQGVVVEYKLMWKLHRQPSSKVIYTNASVNNYVISDLKPGTQYDIRVLAKTHQGWPNISETQANWTTVTMPIIEPQIRINGKMFNVEFSLINASIIKMKWRVNFNDSNKVQQQFDSWEIYCENEKGYKFDNVILARNTTEYLFSNVVSRLSYTINLCIRNVEKMIECLTQSIELSKLKNFYNTHMTLEAVPISPNSINVTWSISNSHYVADSFELCYHEVQVGAPEDHQCLTVNGTMIIVDELKPLSLYHFKVRSISYDSEGNSIFSDSVECYTVEDVPEKIERIEWLFINNTKIKISWKPPNKISGIVQKYFIMYSIGLNQEKVPWDNITVSGNTTSVILPDLITGQRYYVVIQAATKAGFGKPSDPLVIVARSSASKVPTSSNEQKPQESISDPKLGIILGVSISIGFISICLCSIYCRKKYETSRSLRDSIQPIKNQVFTRNSNGCRIQISCVTTSQQMNPITTTTEIELSVLGSVTPTTTNPNSDTKGGHSNISELWAREPLLAPWEKQNESGDIDSLEALQNNRKADSLSDREDNNENLQDTQLTVVNYTLDDSTSSLNNNCERHDNSTLIESKGSSAIPILGPNG